MATYPINQGGINAIARVVPDDGVKFTAMSDGTIRGFTDYDETVFTITVEHYWLAAADRDAIFAFWQTYRTTLNLIETDEGDFNAHFTNRPAVVEKSGPYYKVVSNHVGKAA